MVVSLFHRMATSLITKWTLNKELSKGSLNSGYCKWSNTPPWIHWSCLDKMPSPHCFYIMTFVIASRYLTPCFTELFIKIFDMHVHFISYFFHVTNYTWTEFIYSYNIVFILIARQTRQVISHYICVCETRPLTHKTRISMVCSLILVSCSDRW